MTIGQVRLDDEPPATARTSRRAADPWQRLRAGMAAAVAQFDEDRLDDAYNEALSQYPLDVVTDKVVRPLMAELGERWRKTSGGIAEEHFFAVYLRNKIGARFHRRPRQATGPRLLAACLPGECHETGLLLFALAAHEHGLRVVLLGSDTPLGELPFAVRRGRCEGIVLSVTVAPRPGLLQQELARLVADAGVPVFVGGPCSGHAAGDISAAGAQPLGDDTRRAVLRVADTLGAPRAQRSHLRRP
jgi:methanogenic corrinoid protein MtbC1